MMPWLGSEWEGWLDTPFTFTVTVSTEPAPLGPSIRLVLSVRKSFPGPSPLCTGGL